MKSKKHEIRSAIQRYFKAVGEVNGLMLVEYACECAKLPTDPVSKRDAETVTRYLRDLKSEGLINYEYLGEGKYKVK